MHGAGRVNHSKLHNFINMWKIVKNAIKLCIRFILHKYAKKTKVRCFVHLRVRRHICRIQNFFTKWKLVKTPQNFAQGTISLKLTKRYIKNGDEVFPQFLFNYFNQTKHIFYWWGELDIHCYTLCGIIKLILLVKSSSSHIQVRSP